MFTKLLVPLDGSQLAEQAIGPAAAIARASHAALDIVLVHQTVPFGGFDDAPWTPDELKTEREYLEAIARDVRSGASVPVDCAVERGSPADRIVERAGTVNADLIVMTSHGRTGISRAWFGSIAHSILRGASVPVLTIRPTNRKTRRMKSRAFKRILVTLDGSPLANEILAPATSLARCTNAALVLLQVVTPIPLAAIDLGLPLESPPLLRDDVATDGLVEEAKRQMAAVASALAAEGITDVETDVIIGERVAHAIVDYARGHRIDAIAMSTHGRGVSRLFLGSVADKVMRASDVPLLLQRPVSVPAERPLLDEESIAAQLPALSGL